MQFSTIMKKSLSTIPLSEDEAGSAISSIMNGEWTPAQIASFLTALHIKGETVSEIVGAARAMRSHAVMVPTHRTGIMDTCGTGGDKSGTFNISTTTAFVVAGAGVPVAKHGNRSATSMCGSIDLFEIMGIDINISPEIAGSCIDEIGLGVLFARTVHPAMKHAAPIRSELGFRTIFNYLGPLTNPAKPAFQLVGISDPSKLEIYAQCLRQLGSERAWVVYGSDGLDEITLTGPTSYIEITPSEMRRGEIKPEDVGLKSCSKSDLLGGTPEENLRITRTVLEGTETGPKRDAVLLNAGVSIYISKKTETIQDGIELARQSIDQGNALRILEQLIRKTNQ